MKLHKILCGGRFPNEIRRNVPVVITLTWIFIASCTFGIPYNLFIYQIIAGQIKMVLVIQNFIATCLFCFYPLGGCRVSR